MKCGEQLSAKNGATKGLGILRIRHQNRLGLARVLNVVLLIGGFGLGQGSLFLAQTWLVSEGKMELLANFGVCFSFAMLGIIFTESSSISVVSRQIALAKEPTTELLSRAYSATVIYRLAAGTLSAVAMGLYAYQHDEGAFARTYYMYAAFAPILWAFNFGGVLDGLRLGGLSGLTGALPYISTAVALLAASNEETRSEGLLGAALTVGYLSSVLLQWGLLRQMGWRLRLQRTEARQLGKAFRDGVGGTLGFLPGQIAFRLQLLLVQRYVGLEAVALLVYGRQIASSVSQIIGFARRVEFPNLVQEINGGLVNPCMHIFSMRRMSNILTLIYFAVVGIALILYYFNPKGSSSLYILLSLSVVLIELISASFVQSNHALGRFWTVTVVLGISYFCNLLVLVLVVGRAGLFSVVISDVVGNCLSAVVLGAFFCRTASKAANMRGGRNG